MTLRELIDMARQYNLNLDAQLMVRPLLKDTPRKVTNITTDPGQITLMCNRESKSKKPRR